MPTFTPGYSPDHGTPKSVEFRINSAKFGDGYEQRAADGINAKEEIVTLTWNSLPKATVESITAFMDARAGHESFDYTYPGDVSPKKYICKGYQVHWRGEYFRGLSLSLKQVLL
jgi:phage-related protein